jgi:hypothetical protein
MLIAAVLARHKRVRCLAQRFEFGAGKVLGEWDSLSVRDGKHKQRGDCGSNTAKQPFHRIPDRQANLTGSCTVWRWPNASRGGNRRPRPGPLHPLKSAGRRAHASEGLLRRRSPLAPGSANFSRSGETRQDNDVVALRGASVCAGFEAKFDRVWARG